MSNAVNGEFWQSLVDGWDIENLRMRFCDTATGRRICQYNVWARLFGNIRVQLVSPLDPVDVPGGPSREDLVDFLDLRNNPLVTGQATVDFGLAKADRVEVKVFDVSGRLVRTLADRQFAAGRHSLTWDGADSQGRQVARGVYFTQVRYLTRDITESRKLTILK